MPYPDGWPKEEDRHYPTLPRQEIGQLADGNLILRLKETQSAKPAKRWAASHLFDMMEVGSKRTVGMIHLRLADTEDLVLHSGHVGYGVDEPYRGRHYAARAVRLILPLARKAGMTTLWITTDPENGASRRTLEIAGGDLVEIRELPEGCALHKLGRRQVCRCRFDL